MNKSWQRFVSFFSSHFLFLLCCLYLFTRLFNLDVLPIFTDESIYIYWAKYISFFRDKWFISISDGKPPLLIWVIGVLLSFLPSDWYLIAGRIPAVFFGLLSLIFMVKSAMLLWNFRLTAFLAGLLYIFSPFHLFYDRMALFDSMLSAMLLAGFYFMLKTSKYQKITDSFFWGVFIGLGFLSKGTAIVFFLLLPVIFVWILGFKAAVKKWKKIFLLLTVFLLTAQLINNSLRVSKIYFMMALKNQQFQQPWDLLLENPIRLLWGNYQGILSWIVSYYTLPAFLIGMLAVTYLFFKKISIFLALFGLWFSGLFVFAFLARELFPRYLLFTTPYFLLISAFFVADFCQRFKGRVRIIAIGVMMFLILVKQIPFDFYLLTDPVKAKMPRTDFNQYVGDHPSGYGLDKIFSYLENESQKGKINLVTQGTFGLYPYAFYLRFWDNKNIRIIPKWPIDLNSLSIPELKRGEKYFLVLKDFEYLPPDFSLPILLKSEKPGGRYPIVLTEIVNH